MLIAGRTNLRETIAFPKTASATDLLMNAPSEVSDKQLEDLSVRVAIKQTQAQA
jgi:aspartyl-tRNA synthetase